MSTSRKIALIGYAFRLPGLSEQTAAAFWGALCRRENLVSQVDKSRWEQPAFLHPDKNNPGTSHTFAAGSLGDVSRFDARFFGISPREAAQMDPQQRLLLELAWEAMENAGITPARLRGSHCGVFVGISSTDYAYRRADDLASIDASTMTGNTASIAANRISYCFDLRGPSMAVDTACSSSLVAFHQACLSIAARESEQAFVGGVSLHLHPFGFIGFSKASMLSPRGLCNVFDAAGDGYVRSEGGGVFLLKDYELALADGDPIVAVVAGSGANCDGRTNGLTVPSSEAQAALLEEVYARAGLTPDDIDYLEAHGTGTVIGDPIEARAIGSALGRARTIGPLPIGSVKSNVGHLEAASGVAGMVKALLVLEHREVPATIHLRTPNPAIRFDDWNITPVVQPMPLASDRQLTVGINSFGFGGANAHVVLQSPAATTVAATAWETPELPRFLFLSARDEAALRASASLHADWLERHPDVSLYAFARAAFTGREQMEWRLCLPVSGRKQLVGSLRACAAGDNALDVACQPAVASDAGPVFVYSGNGSQWVGMGRELLATSVFFRDRVAEIDDCFAALGATPATVLLESMDVEALAATEIAQPALFAIQVALTAMLRDEGIRPAAFLGHSVGEVAAAWAAGALTLDQAVKVIHHRSLQQGRTRGTGQMTAAAIDVPEARACLEELGLAAEICIAGINSPKGVTLAGPPAGLARIEAALFARGLFHKRLDLDYAFHSPAMDGVRADLLANLDGLEPAPPAAPFVSTVSGGPLDGRPLDAGYWWDNIRQPVLFAQAIEGLIATGHDVFVEIGPQPVLRNYIRDSLAASPRSGTVIAAMARNEGDANAVSRAIGSILCSGIPVVADDFFPQPAPAVSLPNYPWQRESLHHPVTTESLGLLHRRREHPLLGWRLEPKALRWENHIDPVLMPVFRDHAVGGMVILPGAAFAEMALAAGALWQPAQRPELENLEIHAPLVLEERQPRTVRVVVDPAGGRITISSRARLGDDEWTINATGRLLGVAMREAVVPALQPTLRAAPSISAEAHYAAANSIGLAYGPAFRTVGSVRVAGDSLSATLVTPSEIAGEIGDYLIHPALLDGCFQLLVNLIGRGHLADGHAYIPVRMGRISVYRAGIAAARAEVKVIRRGPRSLAADCLLFAADRSLVARVGEARFRRILLGRAPIDRLRRLAWTALPRPGRIAGQTSSLPGKVARLMTAMHSEVALPAHLAIYRDEVEPLLEVLCSAYMVEAVKRLAGDSIRVDPVRLAESGRIAADRIPLLAEVLALLAEDGILVPDCHTWVWGEDYLLPESGATWLTLLEDYPDFAARIIAVGRMGAHLDRVLAGSVAPAELLPHLDSPAAVAQWTGDSDFHALATLHRILETTAERLPPGRRVRVLELCLQAPRLAPLLPGTPVAEACDYLLALLAGTFQEAADKLRDEWHALATCEWTPAGLSCGDARTFDLILIPEGLARIAGRATLLTHLREQLADGGELLMLEQSPARWSSLLQIGSAPDERLLAPAGWRELLKTAGFRTVGVIEENPDAHSGTAIYAAGVSVRPDALATSGGTWILVAPPGGTGEEATAASLSALASALRERGVLTVEIVAADQEIRSPEPLAARLIAVDRENRPVSGIAFAAGLAGDPQTAEDSLAWQVDCAIVAAAIMRGAASMRTPPSIAIVTRNAVAHLAGGDVRTADAALWGLGRTIINESQGGRVRLIDLSDRPTNAAEAGTIADELLLPDDEDEVVLTAGGRLALRLVALNEQPAAIPATPVVRLDFGQPGQLGNLHWRVAEGRSPGPGEVAIDVRAAGLNFRDVMYAMGLLSDEAVEEGFAGATLGMELAGVVSAVGPGVEAFAPGSEVIAFAPHAFATRVVTAAGAVADKPAGWSFEAAATVPITYFTVYYALHHLARLSPGERVLIHGAAGGVGIAAIRLAQHLGAEIYATAGSEERRQFVRQLGVAHVLDSRSLAFADEILDITGGEGVDVVLNSLAGEAINQNLRALRPFGRFLELGKRDFYEDTRIGLRPFRNNISYFGIDADQLLAANPALTERLFRELMELFADGALKPLPYRAFAASEVVEAFRHMQQSRQIGKVVVSLRNAPPRAECIAESHSAAPLALPAAATYLVTGGTSGFGFATAIRLAARGAHHLVLASRRGAATGDAQDVIENLRSSGVEVRVVECDIARRDQVAALFAEIAANMPPLRGIVHAAMVIDDGLLHNLTPASVASVFAPKVLGAMLLDEYSRDLPLEFFVLYSSATTLFGNPGQGNYVAANHFLEALAADRQGKGLPALAIGWGAIGDVGYLARNTAVKDALASRMGGEPLTSDTALDMLERLLAGDPPPAVGVLELDWSAIARFLPSVASPRFSPLVRRTAAGESDDRAEFQRWLRELPPEELHAALSERLRQEVGEILRIAPEKIDIQKSLYDLGLDSLMAVELITAVDQRFGIHLPVMAISEGPTIARIAERIIHQLKGAPDAAAGDATAAQVRALAEQHGGIDTTLVDRIADQVKERTG